MNHARKRELEMLLSERIDGNWTEPDQIRLEEILLESTAARASYVEFMMAHAAIQESLTVPTADELDELLLLAEAMDVKRIPTLEPPAEATPARTLLGFLSALPTAIQPAQHPVQFLLAAIALTSIFWGLAVLIVTQRTSPGPGQQLARGALPMIPFDARIVRLQDAVWGPDSLRVWLGKRLPAQQQWDLRQGHVQLQFGQGAFVVVEGPAEFTIDHAGAMTLHTGKLLAHVGRPAQGFSVSTPVVRVVDLGTEFGVEVQHEKTAVQVFAGLVEVSNSQEMKASTYAMQAGQASLFANSPSQGFYVKELKMNRLVYASLAAMLALPIPQAALALPVVFQGTAQTEDTALISNNPNDNFGGVTLLDVGTTSGVRRSLLRFPTLSTELSGQTVASATLTLRSQSDPLGTAFTNQPVFLHAVSLANADWVEGNGNAAYLVGTATWNQKVAGSIAWAGSAALGTSGTDYVATAVGSFNASKSELAGTTYSITFSDVSFLQDWIDNPGNNGGFLIRSPSLEGSSSLLRLSSSEGSFAPVLSIELVPPPAPPAPAPEPTSATLLGLGGLVLIRRVRKRSRQQTRC